MEIISGSAQKTLGIGKFISGKLKKGDIVCLFGDLGSGKTVLTKGICLGLGVDKDRVTSPTFVILRQYEGKLPIHHFDLYRLSSPEDILDLGYEEYFFDEGVSVIEWADKLGKLLPKEFLKIQLLVTGENRRKIKISAEGSRYRKLLEDIREDFVR
ncbi:MAG: tRNA (adenosine(37)-N6)-threonylcarbamoyltransferase complex ATPase subunit type 1 TsaE [Candidatus Omnitrophica bacterium]|nr:tRNA (adenosine(37)-N6)-threonylcarbamoyltransferase complex ATPase subunit type 1 TsaE [Candidatus Omnitrophota bacterium]